ncbi:MAG: pseudouridine synthase [Lewinellaceae bacterium]|nr:pseudouridine synthase [Lewinellaceae bacterium]
MAAASVNRGKTRTRGRQKGGGERQPWQDRSEGGERKPWQDRSQSGGGERKPWQDRSEGGERKPWQDRSQSSGGERKPWQDRSEGGERKPWQDRSQSGGGERKPWQDRSEGGERKPWQDRSQSGGGERKPWQDRSEGGERKPWQDRSQSGGGSFRKSYSGRDSSGFGKKPFGRKPFKKEEFHVERKPKPGLPSGADMPLNKYLAHCGLSSRRKAVEFIEQGLVTVNGEVKMEPYYRVQQNDIVLCEGKPVQIQERRVYLLLNKPKGVITTTDDERGRATVLDIVDPHYPERLYPVGRLDRDTTGLLVITNDGEMAAKLTHPSHQVQKQYRVGLDHPLSKADFERIEKGVELEDGLLEVNWVRYSEEQPNRDVIELEITEGRNRVVRRLFEALGYQVRKLDRFYFAGLTKRELPRGSFRELTQREIVMLKHFTGHPSTAQRRAEMLDAQDEPELEVDMETAPEMVVESKAVKKPKKVKEPEVDMETTPEIGIEPKAVKKPKKVKEPEVDMETAPEIVVEPKAVKKPKKVKEPEVEAEATIEAEPKVKTKAKSKTKSQPEEDPKEN